MTVVDCRKLADDLLAPVIEAGRATMRYYGEGVAVERKSDNSPVTLADQEAEDILLAALARIAPDVPVIAEESVAAGRIPEIGRRFFLVDPLDGTKEFINARGDFTINVALIEEGDPVFGIVYAPALRKLYATLASNRAVEADVATDSPAQTFAQVAPRDIRAKTVGAAGLTAVASRSHRNAETEAFLAEHGVTDTRSAGSSLKFCLVARGEADVYPRLAPTSEWDTAAGHAVLRAAGGRVVTLDGHDLKYGNAGGKYLNPSFVAWARRVAE